MASSITSDSSSILVDIKKLLGIESEYTQFDNDIVIHINSALSNLYQIGGIDMPLRITGDAETWSSIFGTRSDLDFIKDYIYLKVRIIFDNSTMSGGVLSAFQAEIKELEWRIFVAKDEVIQNGS